MWFLLLLLSSFDFIKGSVYTVFTPVISVSDTSSGSNEKTASHCFDVDDATATITVQTYDETCGDVTVNGDSYIRLRRDDITGEEIGENDDIGLCRDSKLEVEVDAGRFCFMMGCYSNTVCSYRGKVVVTSAPYDPSFAPLMDPSMEPSMEPTAEPSMEPFMEPSLMRTASPSVKPSTQPSLAPTLIPLTLYTDVLVMNCTVSDMTVEYSEAMSATIAHALGIEVHDAQVLDAQVTQRRQLLDLYVIVVTIFVTVQFEYMPAEFQSNSTGLQQYCQSKIEQYVVSGQASAYFREQLLLGNVAFYDNMAITAVDLSPTQAPVQQNLSTLNEAREWWRYDFVSNWFLVPCFAVAVMLFLSCMLFVYRAYKRKNTKKGAIDSPAMTDTEIEFGWDSNLIFGVGEDNFKTDSEFHSMCKSPVKDDDQVSVIDIAIGRNPIIDYDDVDYGMFDIYGGQDSQEIVPTRTTLNPSLKMIKGGFKRHKGKTSNQGGKGQEEGGTTKKSQKGGKSPAKATAASLFNSFLDSESRYVEHGFDY